MPQHNHVVIALNDPTYMYMYSNGIVHNVADKLYPHGDDKRDVQEFPILQLL